MHKRFFAIGLVLVAAFDLVAAEEWSQLPSIPDREGLAGSFAGVSNGALIVAGGANFPDKKPWEDGKKVWHDEIYVLEKPNGKWITAGRLPRRLAYGVSFTHALGVICVGGSDGKDHSFDAFALVWHEGRIITTQLPPLPVSMAYGCGCFLDRRMVVIGGQENPVTTIASSRALSIDLFAKDWEWTELPEFAGKARILATAATGDRKFFVFGGAELVANKEGKSERKYLRDAWSFDAEKDVWKRIADLPVASVGAPSPAPNGVYLLGGDDGSQLAVAPTDHHGFSKKIFRYDPKADRWSKAGDIPAPRVTAPCVRWNDAWVIPSGEERPGIRSPEVWRFAPAK